MKMLVDWFLLGLTRRCSGLFLFAPVNRSTSTRKTKWLPDDNDNDDDDQSLPLSRSSVRPSVNQHGTHNTQHTYTHVHRNL
uniref:Putative secreted protein n=1 Tax=Anopheles marajoara TaxID=58244 RepID=A0A2M4CC63_9DIPT